MSASCYPTENSLESS